MTHEELRELAAAYALGSLTPGQRLEFEAHLAECAECRDETASFGAVVQGLGYTVPLQQPPASLRARILAAARSEASAASPPIAPEPASAGWNWAALGAVAAVLVLAVGVGIYAVDLRSRVATLETGLREANAATEQANAATELANAELEALRQLAEETDSARAVLGASDLARIDLEGQTTAANARARAFWNRSSGLVFTASELPAIPQGRAYQLWVLTAGAPISAGLLQPDADGSVEIFMQTPLDLPAPTGMAITVEPAGGVPAPTTQPVLVGTTAG